MQDWDVQPEAYCEGLGVGKPLHVSVEWGSVQELFVRVAEVGLNPGSAFVKREGEGDEEGEEGWMGWWIAVGAVGVMAAAAVGMWRRMSA